MLWVQPQILSTPRSGPAKLLLNQFYFISIFVIQCSTLDDVLLSYITGVLEDLGSQQSVEENFDVEVFAEMLEAYIPGFAEIDRWIDSLSATNVPC